MPVLPRFPRVVWVAMVVAGWLCAAAIEVVLLFRVRR